MRKRAAGARVTSTLVTLATAATFLGGVFTGVSAAACSERGRVRELGDWTQIDAPEFSAGAATIAAYAVDPIQPETLYVTNGSSVLKSTDGGCGWETAFSLDVEAATEFFGANSTTSLIEDIVIPESRGGHETVYLLLTQAGSAAQVVVSGDGGVTWAVGNGGLPIAGDPLALAASPSDPATVYVSVRLTPSSYGGAIYRSSNGGSTFELATAVSADAAAPWGSITVDPVDPSRLWGVGDGCVCVSDDGGRTFREVLRPPGQPDARLTLDVFRRRGSPARLLVFTDTQTFYRSDDDGASWEVGQVSDPVASVAHGTGPDKIVAATTEPASRAVVAYASEEETWLPISLPGFPVITDLSSDATSTPSVFGNAGGDGLVRYHGSWTGVAQDLDAFVTPPGRSHATIQGCPEPGPPAPWKEGWDPAPAREPVYITNFRTGYTVKYDSHGTGTVVALAPKFSEGMTLDPLGRLITATRFSHQVARIDPTTCKIEILDHDMYNAEAPTYDYDGNLYVVNTNAFYIWKYPWPQHPRQKPTLVWRMPGFLEDLKIAPPTSPYAGHMFVLYRDRSKDVDDPRVCQLSPQCVTGQPNAVAILEPTEDPQYEGWKRLPVDFASFANVAQRTGNCEGFAALGIAFLPDGRLLVPDICGSGVIRAYAPDGKSFEVFARVDPAQAGGVLVLTKVAVTASGHVYVTGNNSTCGEGQNSSSWVFRFDSEGRALNPPFTQHLTCAVGVAAPTGIPAPPGLPPVKVPDPLDPPPVESKPRTPERIPVRAAAVAPLPPPPPPPLMVPAPAPGQAPVTELAPAPAPNPAPAQAANPMAAVVAQEQQEPQLAFVMAANTVREQVGEQFAMARVSRSNDPLSSARFALLSGTLATVAAFGYVSLSLARARSRVRVRSKGY